MSKQISKEQLLTAHEQDEALKPKLNEVIIVKTVRANGSIREQQDFQNCPSMTEQHLAHLTDINYLMEKYQPDELAQYIAAKNSNRPEITSHDFSAEPSLQDAMNIVYRSKQEFESLPDDLKHSFKNHLEFLKFVDNPANEQKLISLGYVTQKQLDVIQAPLKEAKASAPATTTTQEEAEPKPKP